MNELLLNTIVEKLDALQTSNDVSEEKIQNLTNRIEALKLPAPQVDTKQIEEKIEKGFLNIRLYIDKQPKTIVHKKKVMLLPEFRSYEHYKILLKTILYIIIATYAGLLIWYLMYGWRK